MDFEVKRHVVAGFVRAAADSGLTEVQIAEHCNVSRSTVQRVKAKILAGQTLKDASRSGRPRSIRTSENVAAVSLAIEENPRQSIRSLARKFHFPETSMRELIHEALHMKSHAIQNKPRLTEATRLRRLERSKVLLYFLKIQRPRA